MILMTQRPGDDPNDPDVTVIATTGIITITTYAHRHRHRLHHASATTASNSSRPPPPPPPPLIQRADQMRGHHALTPGSHDERPIMLAAPHPLSPSRIDEGHLMESRSDVVPPSTDTPTASSSLTLAASWCLLLARRCPGKSFA